MTKPYTRKKCGGAVQKRRRRSLSTKRKYKKMRTQVHEKISRETKAETTSVVEEE